MKSIKLLALLFLPLLVSCADLGYYWHSAKGHLAIMDKRVAIDDLLADPDTDKNLKQRLELVNQIRAFSINRLALAKSASYTDIMVFKSISFYRVTLPLCETPIIKVQ